MFVVARRRWALAAAMSLSTIETAAFAESPRTPSSPAPPDAIELTFGTGYARAFGTFGETLAESTVDGLAAEFGIASRIPRASVGLVGQYAELDARSGVRSAKISIAGAYHLLPNSRLDPWIGASLGYRYVHVRDGGLSAHGIELLRAMVGIDVRASQILAAGPMLGFESDAFPGSSFRWYAFGFIGIQGRFDVATACFGD